MFEWLESNSYTPIITLYPGNITLNASASSYFKNVNYTLIGIDKKNKRIALKPIFKKDIDLGIYKTEQLHKIFTGKGYTRITSKSVITEISSFISKEINGLKLECEFDEDKNMLIVNVKENE